jgi:hypothetical protein
MGDIFNGGIGLFLDRGDGHFDPFSARALEHKEGEPSIACNQSKLHL